MDSVGRGCYLGVREERLTMETYVCKKCGEELYLDDVRGWSELACPECAEPIPQEELMLRAGPEEKEDR